MQSPSLAFAAALSAVLATVAATLLVRQRRLTRHMRDKERQTQMHFDELNKSLEDVRLREEQVRREMAASSKQHHFLATATELSESGACICDREGLILWVNTSWEQTTGYTLAEVVGKKPGSVLQGPGSDLAAIDRVRHSLRARRPITEEMRNYRKDGEAIWVRLKITPFMDASGQLEGFFGSIMDLSEERNTRDRLLRIKERAELALAAGNFGVWEWMPIANVCTWDERSCQLFGTRKPAANYEEWMSCIHRGDVQALETRLRNAMMGSSPLDATFRVICSGDQLRYLSIRGLIVRDAQKQPQRVVGIVNDITEEVALRDQLQLAGERLHLSLMGANDGVWEWHVEEDKFLLDDHWAALTGCKASATAITRKELEKQLHPEDLPLLRAVLQNQKVDCHTQLDLECRVLTKSAQWAWVRWRGTVVSVDLAGMPLRVCGTYSDVTARRENEDALRRSALLLRQMCQQMGIAAWELNALSFSFVWTEELDLLHSPPAGFEPTLEHVLALYPQATRRELSNALEASIERGECFDVEVRWQAPGSDKNRWYRWTGGPMIVGDQVQAVCGLIQDVSDSREAAAQRRELDSRLAELHQYESLSAITDDLAYDLNSLLSGMLGFQELACDSLPLGHEARTYLLEAMRTGNRTHDIIRQVLLLNRVKPSARIGLRPHLIVEEACDRLRTMLPESIRLEQKLDRECPPVAGDAAQLQQTLLHLANQAASALLNAGGVLTVQLEIQAVAVDEAARLGLALAGDFMRLEINASGPNLNAEEWLKLFTHPSKDPGMQIASARKIISEHQGTLLLSHNAPTGGQCKVWLPLARTLHHHPPSAAPVPLGSGEAVWIVDDERFIARLAKLSLERNGYSVKLFRTPQDFIAALKLEPSACNVVFLGNVLVGAALKEVLTSAQEIKPSLPAVCLGGHANPANLGNCVVLDEPFTAGDLAKSIHDALNPVPKTMSILGGR